MDNQDFANFAVVTSLHSNSAIHTFFYKNQIISLEPHDSYEIAVLSLKKFLADS